MPNIDVCVKSVKGANMSVDVAIAITGFKGCHAVSQCMPGVLITINDGALAVKETESEDNTENTGVQSAKEAVIKINDIAGDGIIIVISSVQVTANDGSCNAVVGVNLSVTCCGTDKVANVVAVETKVQVKLAEIKEQTVLAGITLVGDFEAGEKTVEVTEAAGKDGATIAEDLQMPDTITDIAEGTQPDKGHALVHPAMDNDCTEVATKDLHTSTIDQKTLSAQDTTFASEVAQCVGCGSSTTVEDTDGEVSFISASNKTCGVSNARVAKVLGHGDCCKCTSEDTVASIGGQVVSDESGAKAVDTIVDTSGIVKLAITLKDNIAAAGGVGLKEVTDVCTVQTKGETENIILDPDCEKSQECSVKSLGGAVATKAGVVIELESKETKYCAEDVSQVICVVAEEGTAVGGGAVPTDVVFVSDVAETDDFEEKTGADTAKKVSIVLAVITVKNVGPEGVAAADKAVESFVGQGSNLVNGERGDTTETGASDFAKASCAISQNVVLAVSSTSTIEVIALDAFKNIQSEDVTVVVIVGQQGGGTHQG